MASSKPVRSRFRVHGLCSLTWGGCRRHGLSTGILAHCAWLCLKTAGWMISNAQAGRGICRCRGQSDADGAMHVSQGRRRRSYSGHGRRCERKAQVAAVAFQQSPPQAQQRRRRQYRLLLRGSCCSLFWQASSATVCTGTEGMTSVCQSGGTGCLTAHRIGD
jgi:hypothetical protein